MHRKLSHAAVVPPCRNIMNGERQFGKHKCWFSHSGKQECQENTNTNEAMERMLDVMEKITERISDLEKSK